MYRDSYIFGHIELVPVQQYNNVNNKSTDRRQLEKGFK
jgi:hypothetical protein